MSTVSKKGSVMCAGIAALATQTDQVVIAAISTVLITYIICQTVLDRKK